MTSLPSNKALAHAIRVLEHDTILLISKKENLNKFPSFRFTYRYDCIIHGYFLGQLWDRKNVSILKFLCLFSPVFHLCF